MNKQTLVLFACAAALLLDESAFADALSKRYDKAVRDAAVASQSEIFSNLVAVTPANDSLVWNADKTKVKVVTWKTLSGYQNNILPYTQTSANEAYVIWVTMAPRIHDFCHNYLQSHPYATQQDLDTRLKQRLGLHPSWQYDGFVELWVSPDDLFRPCADPSPADTSCDLNFGSSIPKVKNIADYGAFYKNLYFNDFRSAPGVPWTGLGYTYDWGSNSGAEGESEFILSPSSPYVIEQAAYTWQYCSQ